jgi:Domain of unknown function (DUF4399)
MNRIVGSIMLCIAFAAHAADSSRTPSPPGARVYFIEPVDGAVVPPTFAVKFGLQGMGVAPAGVDVPNTGHHHLLIDAPVPADMTLPLPATEQIVHFGKGQTETSLTLPPGTHTLQLEFANYLHIPFDPPVESAVITVTVKK